MDLLDLPIDVLRSIFDHLPRRDIKSLRLTGKALHLHARLTIERVFVSPNRTNLSVLNSILGHATFRTQVKEIVWDDARLERYAEQGVHSPFTDWYPLAEGDQPPPPTFKRYVDHADHGYHPNRAPPAIELRKQELWGSKPRISMEGSYTLYRQLYDEQQAIIAAGEDVQALRLALHTLPNVKRLSLTSEAWKRNDVFPLYETPFWRSLPPGFKMPLPWPWMGDESSHFRDYEAPETDKLLDPWTEPHDEWRGYSICMGELVACKTHNIREFVIDVHREPTGISQQLYLSPNEDLANTIRFLQIAPLTRLDLALNTEQHVGDAEWFWQRGWLREALQHTRALRSFHLHLSGFQRSINYWEDMDSYPCVRLQEIFPVPHGEAWPALQHLGLANLMVEEQSIYELLSSLPSLTSIDLDSLAVRTPGISPIGEEFPESLLQRLKLDLVDAEGGGWRTRQPKWTLRLKRESDLERQVYFDNVISPWMYHGGENPFEAERVIQRKRWDKRFDEQEERVEKVWSWEMDDFEPDNLVPSIQSRQDREDSQKKRLRSLLLYP